MPSVNMPTAPLIGGISRQAASDRQPTQVENALDAHFSISDGAEKRMGTRAVTQLDRFLKLSTATWTTSSKTLTQIDAFENYIFTAGDLIHISGGTGVAWGVYEIASKVSDDAITLVESISAIDLTMGDITAGLRMDEDYALHSIDRDDDERYLVLYGRKTVRVFTVDGIEQRITLTDQARDYLDADEEEGLRGVAASDMRMTTIVDYTIVGNTNVVMRTTGTDHYAVDADHEDYDDMIATTPAAGTHHRTKFPSSGQPAGYYLYDPGDATPAVWKGAIVGGGWAVAENYHGTDVNPGRFRIVFRKPDQFQITQGNWTEGTLTLTATGKFAGYTFSAGDEIYISGGTDVIPGLYTIASKTSNDAIVLTSSLSAIAGDLSNNNITTFRYDLDCEVVMDFPFGTFTGAPMDDVAAEIQTILQVFNPNILCAWEASTSDAGRFAITGPYVGAGAYIFGPFNTTGQLAGTDASHRWSEQPPLSRSKNWFTTPGIGDPKARVLDIPERWTRVAAPGQRDGRINIDTMPHKLVRLTIPYVDDDGIYQRGSWLLESIDWVDRFSGASSSNPPPLIFREDRLNKIGDTIFHRNRFGIAADESITFGQDGDFFNFWIDDVTNLKDSDPVETPMATNQVTIIDFIEPFNRGLIVQTRTNRQIQITAAETFTASTVTANSTTDYSTIQGVRPCSLGSRAYLAGNTQNRGAIYEYVFDEGDIKNIAGEITSHIRGLIPADIKRMVASPNANCIIVITHTGDKIYYYQTHFDQVDGVPNVKVQAAWTVYSVPSDERVVSVAIVRDRAYFLFRNESDYFIDYLDLTDRNPEYERATLFGDKILNLDYTDFIAISDGSFSISIDGVQRDIYGCDFTSAVSTTDIASIITTRLQAEFGPGPTCRIHKINRFVFTSGSASPLSEVFGLAAHTGGVGTNIATLIGGPGTSYGPQQPYVPKLDRGKQVQGVYDPGTGKTRWDYGFDDPNINRVVFGRDFGAECGLEIEADRVNNHAIEVEGDYSVGLSIVGRPYEMNIELSRPYVRDQNGSSLITADIQLLDVTILHHDTGDYRVRVIQEGHPTIETSMRSMLIGSSIIGDNSLITEGTFAVPINGPYDKTRVQIVNDTAMPCKIVKAQFQAHAEQKLS